MHIRRLFSVLIYILCMYNLVLSGAVPAPKPLNDGAVVRKRLSKQATKRDPGLWFAKYSDNNLFKTMPQAPVAPATPSILSAAPTLSSPTPITTDDVKKPTSVADLVTPKVPEKPSDLAQALTAIPSAPAITVGNHADDVEKPTSVADLVAPKVPEKPSDLAQALTAAIPSVPAMLSKIISGPHSTGLSRRQKKNRREQIDLLPPAAEVISHVSALEPEDSEPLTAAKPTSIEDIAVQAESLPLPQCTTNPPASALAIPAVATDTTFILEGPAKAVSIYSKPKKTTPQKPHPQKKEQLSQTTAPQEPNVPQLPTVTATAPVASGANNSTLPALTHNPVAERNEQPEAAQQLSEYEKLIMKKTFFFQTLSQEIQNPRSNMNKQDENGNTPLHMAALLGSLTAVRAICINRKDADIHAKNNSNETPLNIVKNKLIQLQQDTSPNQNTRNEIVNLKKICDLLIAENTRRNATSMQTPTTAPIQLQPHVPLSPAQNICNPNQELLSDETLYESLLLQILERFISIPGSNVNQKNDLGNTFLHLAAQEESLAGVKTICTHPDADIHAKNNSGETPLDIVMNQLIQLQQNKSPDQNTRKKTGNLKKICDFLIAENTRRNAISMQTPTTAPIQLQPHVPTLAPAQPIPIKMTQFPIPKGAQIEITTSWGLEIMTTTDQMPDQQSVNAAIEKYLQKRYSITDPIQSQHKMASSTVAPETMQFPMQKGAQITIYTPWGKQVAIAADPIPDQQSLNALTDKYMWIKAQNTIADPTSNIAPKDSTDNTILHFATMQESLADIQTLYGRTGIDHNARNILGDTAFDIAVQSLMRLVNPTLGGVPFDQNQLAKINNLERICEFFTSHNARRYTTCHVTLDIDTNPQAQEPIQLQPHVPPTAASSAANNRPEIQSSPDELSLHHFAQTADFEGLRAALERPQIDINAQDPSGNTALHYAVGTGSLRTVTMLYHQPKIAMNLQNRSGEAPLDIALKGISACNTQSQNPGYDTSMKDSWKVIAKILKNKGARSFTSHETPTATLVFPDAQPHTPRTIFSSQQRPTPKKHLEPKRSPNDPCHCGSGKKFKKCHSGKPL